MPRRRGRWRAQDRWREDLERHPLWWIGIGVVTPLALMAVAIRLILSIALTAMSVRASPSGMDDVAAGTKPSPAASGLRAIEFLTGRPTPSPEGRRQIAVIAETLAAEPQLTLHLQPSAGTADESWAAVRSKEVSGLPATMRKLAEQRAGRAMVRLTTFHRVRREQIAIEPEVPEQSAWNEPAAAAAGGMTVVPGIFYWFTG